MKTKNTDCQVVDLDKYKKRYMLTIPELAVRWNVSQAFLLKHRYNGTGVPMFKLCGVLRIKLEDVEAFEEKCRCISTSAANQNCKPNNEAS